MSQTHLHAQGTAPWDASDAVLDFLARTLRADMRTLETGAGRSTLLFARAGCRHDTVTPSESEVQAIRASALAEGVDLGHVTFHVGFSQDVLPRLDGGEDLDVVFIDGGHGFPIPAVDFQYLAPRVAVGGVLLVDDINLWSVDMVVRFLRHEDGWADEGTLNRRTAVFRKTAPFQAHEWTRQRYTYARSWWPQMVRRARNGVDLALRGDLRAIARKLAKERALARAARDDY
jgi:hypothetical protein